MHIVERCITLDELREERFEPFTVPPLGAALHDSVPMGGQGSRWVVVDLALDLAGPESRELGMLIKRLIERGERTIVINLKSVTTVDRTGLGERISCYANIIHSGGALLLANAPRQFRQLVEREKFL